MRAWILKYPLVALLFCIFSCRGGQAADEIFHSVDLVEGDLVFRRGTGAKAEAVLRADSQQVYSHAGIAVRTDTTFGIVHITPGEREKGDTADFIKIEPLEVFFGKRRAVHGAVYRLPDRSKSTSAARHALRLLDRKIVFDHDYSLDDTARMYCTQLIWHCYLQAGTDISNGRRSEIANIPLYSGTYILPSDIYTSKELVLIFKF
ncbi:MAG: hypothetical protein LBH19_15250 [Dysgonamonadaceae bacterium]|nr:hypothetical protein [Dysgonamonadaceae bacterium]